jgi:hypothetical protein
MTLAAVDRLALIHLIVAYATDRRGAVSKIRLIKFLYLADVHAFQRTDETLTGYRWRFYHYGPWALEAQTEIEDCMNAGMIESIKTTRDDQVGDVTLYRAPGSIPGSPPWLNATVEMLVKRDIHDWLDQPLPRFLDYVYFGTPPMHEAKRGDYLRFDRSLFSPAESAGPAPKRRYSSREARMAFRRLLEERTDARDRVPVPKDGIADQAYAEALDSLDAQDRLSGPLEGLARAEPEGPEH